MDWLYHESTILVFIAALAVILFVSGLLHLLVRVLLRPNTVGADPTTNATVFQGQLQQLFHLHDAGVDQSFIDTLPVFQYKAIIGLKDPFDCAVCLCEFEEDDKLRLLPECSHAFHLHCIDTWLLSHSTCPLCRRCLVEDLSPASSCRRLVFVLESGSESSGPTVAEDESVYDASAAEEEEEVEEVAEEKVVHVKLGKFRSADGGGGQSRNFDQRRCFSMGSYEYMMDDSAPLRVAIRPPSKKKPAVKKQSRRFAMSECDCYSRREGFKGFLEPKIDGGACLNANKESFSFSKIWMRSRMEKATVAAAEEEEATAAASRRAFSFRLPLRRDVGEETKAKKSGSEVDLDVEAGGFCDAGGAVSRVDETPSFARRTLLWVLGRQSKVGDDHS